LDRIDLEFITYIQCEIEEAVNMYWENSTEFGVTPFLLTLSSNSTVFVSNGLDQSETDVANGIQFAVFLMRSNQESCNECIFIRY